MAERINTTVTVKGIYEFEVNAYGGWGTETRRIYNFTTEDGTVYVWKTSSLLSYDVQDDADRNTYVPCVIHKGDVISIKASIKGQSEYKGQPQTVLQRVSVVERLVEAKTPAQIKMEQEEAKKQEQMDSLHGEDFIWRMPYRQYKDHYSDCETLAGSYNCDDFGYKTIAVIIREGRLVASGVRGKHYHGYEFRIVENGKNYRTTYRAVSEENALRRAVKDFPNAESIEPGIIYNYGE